MTQKKRHLLLDERNIARLGIVSIQTRLSDESRWVSEFTVGERRFRMEGRSADGRPRGIDTNILLGVETLFAAKGMPEDNWLHTTAYELREASFLANNGRSYGRLRESLLRLWSTGFIVSEGWVAVGQSRTTWASQTLRLIERIAYWEQSDDQEQDRERELIPEATLSIKLGDQLAASIRAGYTQALDGALLHRMEQPTARALYRLLEAHRYNDAGVQDRVLTVSLDDWRAACGINSDKPSRVLRVLQEAHEELLTRGYLEGVLLEGKRGNTTTTYQFRSDAGADPDLVRQLRDAGVSAPRANVLARDFPERVPQALRFLSTTRAEGRSLRNPAGLLADVIEHPEKYVLPETEATPVERLISESRRAEQRERLERQAEEEHEARQRALLALPAADQWAATEHTLRALLGRRLATAQWHVLEERCVKGELHAAALVRKLSAAAVQSELQAAVEALQAQLDALP